MSWLSEDTLWQIFMLLALVVYEMSPKDHFVTVKAVTAAMAWTPFERHLQSGCRTFQGTVCVNLWAANFSRFRKKSKLVIYVMRGRRLVHSSPIFGVKEKRRMKPLNHPLQNCKLFRIQLNRYREIVTRTWSKMNTFMLFVTDRKSMMTSLPVEV